MRKLASVQQIVNIRPIEGADKIVTASVLGWEVVVSKSDNFKIGDRVVYIEVDSICPPTPEFEFLRDRNFRVKTIKLKKQISQGLILPLSVLPKGKYNVGDDVSSILKITQYIPDGEKEGRGLIVKNPKNKFFKYMMKYEWFRNIWFKFNKPVAKNFPSWIVKTDEDRIQSRPSYLLDKSRLYYSTIKMDGSSMTMAIKGQEYFICSRNVKLDEKALDSNYIRIANRIEWKNVLNKLKEEFKAESIVLQGEMCGPTIQGNKYNLSDLELFIFNLIIDGHKIPTYDIIDIFKNLDINVKTVPVVVENKDAEDRIARYTYKLPDTVEEMLIRAQGDSILYPTTREGIVVRSEDQEISFKTINNDFLLKEKD